MLEWNGIQVVYWRDVRGNLYQSRDSERNHSALRGTAQVMERYIHILYTVPKDANAWQALTICTCIHLSVGSVKICYILYTTYKMLMAHAEGWIRKG